MGTQRKRNELPSLKHQSITNWFNWPSCLSAVGPQVSQVVFDGGRRREVSESARAGYDASVAVYRQNAIDAFREVEDNLAVLWSIFAPPLTGVLRAAMRLKGKPRSGRHL